MSYCWLIVHDIPIIIIVVKGLMMTSNTRSKRQTSNISNTPNTKKLSKIIIANIIIKPKKCYIREL